MALLQFDKVSVRFSGPDGRETPALDSFSATVEAGEAISIIGANGSGKTTLFNALAGAAALSGGRILVDGEPVHHLAAHRRAKWLCRVFQNPYQGTASELTVADNFRLAGLRTQAKLPWFSTGRQFEEEAKAAIAGLGLGLEDKWNQPMGSLSGGQRQTLTVLMATLAPARILLLDEPVAALDLNSARLVMETAQRIASERQMTVLHITHKLSDALAFGNRLWVMRRGHLIADIQAAEKAALSMAELEHRFFTGA